MSGEKRARIKILAGGGRKVLDEVTRGVTAGSVTRVGSMRRATLRKTPEYLSSKSAGSRSRTHWNGISLASADLDRQICS